MRYLSLSFLLLIGFNIFTWNAIAVRIINADILELHFLDVGQGDSQLIKLPGGSKILIDGGPDKEISFKLDKILPQTDRYIDFIILTHTEKDHLGGLADVVSRYQIGAFLWNGKDKTDDAWSELKSTLSKHNVPTLQLSDGDKITQNENVISVVSPNDKVLNNPNNNERSLVLMLESQGIKALYAGDIGVGTESKLIKENELDADILKVAHHGSKFSTGIEFLGEVTPAIAVIEVGDNSYGHPHPTTLQKLRMAGVSVYRTDEVGTISLLIKDGIIGVKTER
jgi:competence protein ComEC